ncbi:hypothetical protein [Sabulibacter ruber]|uniref:hypothetical protein n=1 Tax=Sabulibacter ruber TaxID=2811901 RepID=UPI001A979C73|nr:hypothetical protein [Sabulibacter ruber]
MKKDYKVESETLAKAIDIAIECVENVSPDGFNSSHKEHFIAVYLEWKNKILNPEPQFKKLQSLKYNERDVFIYFQEAKGATVELFWKKMKEAGLPYRRKNPLIPILKRKRIKDDLEYDHVTDVVVGLEQDGTITQEQAKDLKSMIGEYENRKNNRP